MKLKAIQSSVIADPIIENDKTSTGLLVARANKDQYTRAKVTSVGLGSKKEDMHVNIGDVIWFSKMGGTRINIETRPAKPPKEIIIIQQREILGVEG